MKLFATGPKLYIYIASLKFDHTQMMGLEMYFCLQSWQCWVFNVLMLMFKFRGCSSTTSNPKYRPKVPLHSIKTKLAGNPSSTKKETCNCHLRLPDHKFRCFPAQTPSVKLLFCYMQYPLGGSIHIYTLHVPGPPPTWYGQG